MKNAIELLKQVEDIIQNEMEPDKDGVINDADLIFFYRATYTLRDSIEKYIEK